MTLRTQDPGNFIIKSLSISYICIWILCFTIWAWGDTKTILVLLQPRVIRYIRYYKCNTFLKIAALTACSLPSEYHGKRYTNDNVSVCMVKYIFLPSLLARKCYVRAPGVPLLFMINLWVCLEAFKVSHECFRRQLASLFILLVTCKLSNLWMTGVLLIFM